VAELQMPEDGFPMEDDRIIGDAGNLTVYERPDKSRYTLDAKGRGAECEADLPTFGRARFDSRIEASGRWPESRSRSENRTAPGGRARRHGASKAR
jgi:hypothetical protein